MFLPLKIVMLKKEAMIMQKTFARTQVMTVFLAYGVLGQVIVLKSNLITNIVF